MPPRRRAALLLVFALATEAVAGISPVEQARIDRLIEYIESRSDLMFIRNGTDYSCKDAAKFMRRKLRAMGEHVTTAQQFIDEIASKSSTTGQPYLIRYPDGKTMTAARFLGDELKRIDGKT
jgi:Family of unknown function (DUF5329)